MKHAMLNDPLDDVRALLLEWGVWSRRERPGPGALKGQLAPVRAGLPVRISDDTGLRVDRAVRCLRQREPLWGDAVRVYYTRHPIAYDGLAKALEIHGGRGRDEARERVRHGEIWLDAVLFGEGG